MYREELREDHWYSCAYCTITEIEAMAVGFQIDHYIPTSHPAGQKLKNDYNNLMWSCAICNRRKGEIHPGPQAQAAGMRLFRPDVDAMPTHFELEGLRVKPLTPVGVYTERVLHLNRKQLRDLRSLRTELHEANQQVLEGIRSLSRVRIDHIHPRIRAEFRRLRTRLAGQQDEALAPIEALVAELRSPFLDPDPDHRANLQARRDFLEGLKALGVPEIDIEGS